MLVVFVVGVACWLLFDVVCWLLFVGWCCVLVGVICGFLWGIWRCWLPCDGWCLLFFCVWFAVSCLLFVGIVCWLVLVAGCVLLFRVVCCCFVV